MNLILLLLLAYLLFALYVRQKQAKKPHSVAVEETFVPKLHYDFASPDWAKNAVVYQINVRHFTPEGNFRALMPHLSRIRALGSDIIWLMPIFPICETEKKCDPNDDDCWGSPYAPFDFEAIHPRYGNDADFQALVDAIHAEGMKVILDFVPNHTGFDSKWMLENPEWFVRKNGKVQPVTSDQGEIWADIAQLDLTNRNMREAWMQAHEYWVKKFGIDGYREDCAWAIAPDFWLELRQRLDALRPVFMLAEDEVHGFEQFAVCFEANYGWGAHHFMKKIAQNALPAAALYEHTEGIKKRHGTRGWQLNFTQNHDENTWHGTETELFGAGAGDCYTALAFMMEGMGLIYNGQEASLNKRLSFFGKDELDWSGTSRADFFKTLTDLKHTNQALWHGEQGGFIQKITTSNDAAVYAFAREKNGDKVVAIFNMKNTPVSVKINGEILRGGYRDVFDAQNVTLSASESFDFEAFGYKIFAR